MASTRRSASQDVGRNVPTSNPSPSSPPTKEQALMTQTQPMEEKKRKHDLQCQLRNTHPRFATQPKYQPLPTNLLVRIDQNQYQQPDDEVQQVSSQEPEQNVHGKQVHGNKLKRNYILGRLNNVDMTTTHGAKEVVYGLIVVGPATAMVRFDPIASHSFISSAYVKDHKITMLPMRKPVKVKSPGREMKAKRICTRVSLDIKGKNLKQTLLY